MEFLILLVLVTAVLVGFFTIVSALNRIAKSLQNIARQYELMHRTPPPPPADPPSDLDYWKQK